MLRFTGPLRLLLLGLFLLLSLELTAAPPPADKKARVSVFNETGADMVSLVYLDLTTEEYSPDFIPGAPIESAGKIIVSLPRGSGYLYGLFRSREGDFWASIPLELKPEELFEWKVGPGDLKMPELQSVTSD